MGAYATYFREYSLLIEYKQLLHYAPKGVYVCPGKASAGVWDGLICLRQGLYKGGCFKFAIGIPDAYPEERPTFRFTSPVFHPRVAPADGSVDLAVPFPAWRPHNEYMWHVLAYVKKLFYTEIDTDAPLNADAAELYAADRDAYALQARQSVQASLALLYVAKGDSALTFDEWKPEHDAALARIVDGGADAVDAADAAVTDDLFRRIAAFAQ